MFENNDICGINLTGRQKKLKQVISGKYTESSSAAIGNN
jgi:hypothetical protein